MSQLVQCECGHQFFTKKNKPQCTKCRRRFDVTESSSNTVADSSLKSLQARWNSQIQVVEGLMNRLKVEQIELNKISQQIKNHI